MLELADVVGVAEPGLPPGLLAQGLGQPLFDLPDAGGQTASAFMRGHQVGLQCSPGDGGSAARLSGWLGFAGVDLLEQGPV